MADAPAIETLEYRIAPGAEAMRLDQALTLAAEGRFSRSRLQALIAEGQVTVNGAPAPAARMAVRGGDLVTLTVPEAAPAEPAAQAMALDILFEDNDLIVLVKPAGLTVHPGAGAPDGTLVNALIAHCGDTLSGIGGVKRPGIVHRLDKETSGVMVVAKNDAAHKALSAQFADHGRSGALDRRYHALFWGAPSRPSGTVNAPLGRSSSDRTKRAVVAPTHPDAREAITHYQTLERFGAAGKLTDKLTDKLMDKPAASLVECRLETGRTHQIRVHMAHAGHPLIGDQVYGKGFQTRINLLPETARGCAAKLKRQALHAASLAFEHPRTGKVMAFAAPPPPDFEALLQALRQIGG
jgi:23S rRNA pseudouridine1911/1915/1917 synthase